jgi:hypothetical protein
MICIKSFQHCKLENWKPTYEMRLQFLDVVVLVFYFNKLEVYIQEDDIELLVIKIIGKIRM